jgi:hypothetical protein
MLVAHCQLPPNSMPTTMPMRPCSNKRVWLTRKPINARKRLGHGDPPRGVGRTRLGGRRRTGKKVVIDGLWGLQCGNGASLGEANHMCFAAGPEKRNARRVRQAASQPAHAPHVAGFAKKAKPLKRHPVDTGPSPLINDANYCACDKTNQFFYQRNMRFSVPAGDTLGHVGVTVTDGGRAWLIAGDATFDQDQTRPDRTRRGGGREPKHPRSHCDPSPAQEQPSDRRQPRARRSRAAVDHEPRMARSLAKGPND